MTKHLKRFIAVCLVVLMAVAYVPVADIDGIFGIEASAIVTNGKVKLGDNISWKYDNKSRTITVSGSGAMYNYSNGDDGQRWDELVLGLTHYPNKDARSIVISNGITSIGNNVFNGLSGVTSVTIPSSVKTIGDGAFKGCSSLSSVTVPAAVTSIGKSAFEGCSAGTETESRDDRCHAARHQSRDRPQTSPLHRPRRGQGDLPRHGL